MKNEERKNKEEIIFLFEMIMDHTRSIIDIIDEIHPHIKEILNKRSIHILEQYYDKLIDFQKELFNISNEIYIKLLGKSRNQAILEDLEEEKKNIEKQIEEIKKRIK
jgi:hypothetical protein